MKYLISYTVSSLISGTTYQPPEIHTKIIDIPQPISTTDDLERIKTEIQIFSVKRTKIEILSFSPFVLSSD